MSDAPAPAPLDTDDALGIVQRALVDLHQYMAQPPGLVDPQVCMAYLNKCAEWVQRLPPIQYAPPNGPRPEAQKGKAN